MQATNGKKKDLLIPSFFGVILLLILASYSNVLHSPPVLDDLHSFVFQPVIRQHGLSIHTLLAFSETIFGWSRWIPMATFSFDYWMGGGDITNFHATNIVIHCLAMFAVFFLSSQLLEASSCIGNKYLIASSYLQAAFIAGLWALHPVQTNAVTYLVQRMTSLQALFYILSVAFYVLGRRRQVEDRGIRGATPCYALCLLFSICAFVSKQNSATLPFTLFLTELWFFQPDLIKHIWELLKRRGWLTWTFLTLVCIAGSVCAYKVIHSVLEGYGIRDFTLSERLLTESRIVIWYISLLLWPAPSRMSLEHDVVVSTSLWSPPTTLLSIVTLGSLLYLIVRYRKQYPVATYAGMWFFLNLVIESTFVPLELLFEHRLYLPSFGTAMLIVTSLTALATKYLGYSVNASVRDFQVLMICGFALLMSGLTLTTFERNEAWCDAVSIYSDALAKSPGKARSHANVATALYRVGAYDDAIQEAETAIKIGQPYKEQYIVAANTIVRALTQQGKIGEAVNRGQELFAGRPKFVAFNAMPDLCASIAMAYNALGKPGDAYAWAFRSLEYAFQRSDESDVLLAEDLLVETVEACTLLNVDLDGDGAPDPGRLDAKAWVAKHLLTDGNLGEAEKLASLAASEHPDNQYIREILGVVLKQRELNRIQAKNWDITGEYLKLPTSAFDIYMSISHLCRKQDSPKIFRKLGEHFVDRALNIRPDSCDAYLLKGWCSFQNERVNDAVAQAKRATELEPDNARAWLELGFFLTKADDNAAAASAFETVLDLYPGYSRRGMVRQMIITLREETKAS